MKRKRRYQLLMRWRKFAAVMRTEENEGILKRAIMDTGVVDGYTLCRGGWRGADIEVVMNDGFEIDVCAFHGIDAIRLAGFEIYQREVSKIIKPIKTKHI